MVKFHQWSKNVINGTTWIYSYTNIYNVINKAHSRLMQQKCHTFFSLLLNQYILNISNIYNVYIHLSLASQTICDLMFSDPKSDRIFLYFWLRTRFIYFFFSYVAIYHLLQRQGGVEIYYKFITDLIKSTRAIILFTAQYRTGIKNQIRKTTWRSISK